MFMPVTVPPFLMPSFFRLILGSAKLAANKVVKTYKLIPIPMADAWM